MMIIVVASMISFVVSYKYFYKSYSDSLNNMKIKINVFLSFQLTLNRLAKIYIFSSWMQEMTSQILPKSFLAFSGPLDGQMWVLEKKCPLNMGVTLEPL